ncbi:MAG: TolC family protein [Deltaproteobacteria bacterium]|nr:TolC family protein [Deltaproteobacteria bacterium]
MINKYKQHSLTAILFTNYFLVTALIASRFVSATELEGPSVPPTGTTDKGTVVLNLDELVKRAIGNSDQISAERFRLNALDFQRKAMLWEPFSQFYIQGRITMVPEKCQALNEDGGLVDCSGGNSIDADENWDEGKWGPSFHFKFQGGIPIPTSNKISAGKTALDEGIKAKSAMLPTIQNEIRYNVHRAFHAIIGAREMLYTLSEGRKHLVKSREKIEQNLANQEGTETEIDLVKIKVFEAQLDAMEQEAILIEKQGLAALNFLVKLPGGKRVDIPEDPQQIVDTDIKTLPDYQQAALDHRPELEALRHAVNAFEAKVSFQKSEFIPDLAFVVSLRAAHTPNVHFKRNTGTTANPRYEDADMPYVYENSYNYGSIYPVMGLVMSYPLDLGKDINKLKQAKAELTALVHDQKFAIEGISLEVETAYIEVTTTLDAINALNRSKRLARGWMLAAVQNHATGIGEAKEVKDALKEYFGIMAQIHQKIAAYNIGLAKLEKVTGIDSNSRKTKKHNINE